MKDLDDKIKDRVSVLFKDRAPTESEVASEIRAAMTAERARAAHIAGSFDPGPPFQDEIGRLKIMFKSEPERYRYIAMTYGDLISELIRDPRIS